MNYTGITKRVDGLGKIAIPKDVIRHLNLKEGAEMEVYVEDDCVVFKKRKLTLEEKVYSIIEIFEDFLKERGVRIPTSDIEMKEMEEFEDNDAVIYGCDYGELQDRIKEILE